MDELKDLVETIVDENTQELIDRMETLKNWKTKTSEKIDSLGQEMDDLIKDFKDVNSAFIDKKEVIDVKTLKPKQKTL